MYVQNTNKNRIPSKKQVKCFIALVVVDTTAV